jgi:hypothetical protein
MVGLALPLRLALLGLPPLLGLRLPLLIRNDQVSLTSARRHGQASTRPAACFFCVVIRFDRGERAAMIRGYDDHDYAEPRLRMNRVRVLTS